MSGRKRIINGEIAQGKLKGKALSDALAKEMNQDEKSSSYQNRNIDNDKKTSIHTAV